MVEPRRRAADAVVPPFAISSGATAACPSGGVPPFAPGVTRGYPEQRGGLLQPARLRITRNDGEQEITGFASQLPPGLTGNLSGVP